MTVAEGEGQAEHIPLLVGRVVINGVRAFTFRRNAARRAADSSASARAAASTDAAASFSPAAKRMCSTCTSHCGRTRMSVKHVDTMGGGGRAEGHRGGGMKSSEAGPGESRTRRALRLFRPDTLTPAKGGGGREKKRQAELSRGSAPLCAGGGPVRPSPAPPDPGGDRPPRPPGSPLGRACRPTRARRSTPPAGRMRSWPSLQRPSPPQEALSRRDALCRPVSSPSIGGTVPPGGVTLPRARGFEAGEIYPAEAAPSPLGRRRECENQHADIFFNWESPGSRGRDSGDRVRKYATPKHPCIYFPNLLMRPGQVLRACMLTPIDTRVPCVNKYLHL